MTGVVNEVPFQRENIARLEYPQSTSGLPTASITTRGRLLPVAAVLRLLPAPIQVICDCDTIVCEIISAKNIVALFICTINYFVFSKSILHLEHIPGLSETSSG